MTEENCMTFPKKKGEEIGKPDSVPFPNKER